MRIKVKESKMVTQLLMGLEDEDWIAAAQGLEDHDFEVLVALARLTDGQSNTKHADALVEWRKPKPKSYVASFHFEATEELSREVFEKMQEIYEIIYPKLNLRAKERSGEFARGVMELKEVEQRAENMPED